MASNDFSINGLDELIDLLDTTGLLEDAKTVVRYHGSEFQRKAHRRAAKDTGELRRGIRLRFEDGGLTAVIESTVKYAAYVEYGTRYQQAQPYMRPTKNEQQPLFFNDVLRLLGG